MTAPTSRRTGVSRRRAAMLVVVAMIAVLVPLASAPAPAVAASAADWDAGYIIDDSVFYDSNAMTSYDVQAFLDGKVSSCSAGYTCLKSYGQSTATIAADRYCDGYRGSAYQTAAQIIDAVARSCGISQRAILVLLEKEQGLVSSRAPSAWAYKAAMGQGCPDTAPCDPSVAGFFYQVYYGARQFEVYRLNPDSFGYRAGRTNNILYNPKVSCGTKSVYIANQATAALYIYTPYTPNAAALKNLYGTGDSCSAYGNRNFWRLFTDWFGDPRRYTVLDGFLSYYNANGGASGRIGSPASYPVFVEQNGQGWYQRFTGGTLYGSYTGGTVFVPKGAILDGYDREGGPYQAMGWPNGEQRCTTAGACVQSFVSSVMTSTKTYGAHALWGGVKDHWLKTGGLEGSLGAAVNTMVYSTPAAGPAWVQNFQSGVLVQSAAGFVLVPYSKIQTVWARNGSGQGALGWPTTAYKCEAVGCSQRFTGGAVTDEKVYGAHAIVGGFGAEWTARGGMSGLGAALNDQSTSSARGGGSLQNFSAGILAGTSAGRFFVPYGPIQRMWSANGAEAGADGWPVGAQECAPSGCTQTFQLSVLSTSTWGTYSTFGSLASTWKSSGGMAGFGPALNSIRFGTASGGAWSQHYATGVLTQRVGGAPVFSPYGPIIDMWYHYGAETTWLGWPTAAPTCDAGSCVQQFQNGVARSNGGGVSFSRS
ncbi:LGFP repeat-containing protein [Microbacterium sp. E-13]|uniref:LGFP repeat-containing protein n=1 Tax=Microbacterium sp. E-13 TaxID=3404048 RepID=UPI003CECF74C